VTRFWRSGGEPHRNPAPARVLGSAGFRYSPPRAPGAHPVTHENDGRALSWPDSPESGAGLAESPAIGDQLSMIGSLLRLCEVRP